VIRRRHGWRVTLVAHSFPDRRGTRHFTVRHAVGNVQGGKVENVVGRGLAAGYKIHAVVVCSLPRASLLAGARCGLHLRDLWAYAATNSVPSRSIACMMIARRRAKGMRALRMLDRLAIANAHSFSLSRPL
jgi:hypothetical protein